MWGARLRGGRVWLGVDRGEAAGQASRVGGALARGGSRLRFLLAPLPLDLDQLEIQLLPLKIGGNQAHLRPLADANPQARRIRNHVGQLVELESPQRLALHQAFDPGIVELHEETEVGQRRDGADEFLAFIEDELKPEIARRVAVDVARQAIFGHSFGGLFVLHALFHLPEAFSTWVAISPAIWWEGAGILEAAERFEAARTPVEGRVLVAAGEYEQRLAPFQEGVADAAERIASHAESRIVDNARAMAERLSAIPGLHAEFELYRGETHMSVLPAAVNSAVRFAFGPAAFRTKETCVPSRLHHQSAR